MKIGDKKTKVMVAKWRACQVCGMPASFRITYLFAGNYRGNPASSAYGKDDCSWCSDAESFACKKHMREVEQDISPSMTYCSTFTLKGFKHMGFYWEETPWAWSEASPVLTLDRIEEEKMEEQALNIKLAEWAGFTYAYPEGKSHPQSATFISPDRNPCYLPEFTKSLDACFKWLISKLEHYDLWYGAPRASNQLSVREHNAAVWVGHDSGYAHNKGGLALALCLAIENCGMKHLQPSP